MISQWSWDLKWQWKGKTDIIEVNQNIHNRMGVWAKNNDLYTILRKPRESLLIHRQEAWNWVAIKLGCEWGTGNKPGLCPRLKYWVVCKTSGVLFKFINRWLSREDMGKMLRLWVTISKIQSRPFRTELRSNFFVQRQVNLYKYPGGPWSFIHGFHSALFLDKRWVKWRKMKMIFVVEDETWSCWVVG